MSKSLNEEMKRKIAEMYNTSNMSMGSIAEALRISKRSVQRYKDYDVIARSSSTQISRSSQAIESIEEPIESIQSQPSNTIEEPDNIEYEAGTTPDNDDFSEKKSFEYVKMTECPNCGNPINKCIPKNLAFMKGIGVDPEYEDFVDYCCPECETWFPGKKVDTEGKCPKCGAGSAYWMPIEDTYVSDEEKRNYDFLCINCFKSGRLGSSYQLIKLS